MPSAARASTREEDTAKEAEGGEKADAFKKWVQKNNCNVAEFGQAFYYLEAGPPFFLSVPFDCKDAAKLLGAKWRRNVNKQHGVRDGLEAGWWVAMHEQDLKALLQIDGIYARDVCKDDKSTILKMIHLYELETVPNGASTRVSQAPAQTPAPAPANASGFSPSQSSTDEHGFVRRLCEDYNVVWTDDLAATAYAMTELGPRADICGAERVFRGLRLGIVTKAALLNGAASVQTERQVKRQDADCTEDLGATQADPCPEGTSVSDAYNTYKTVTHDSSVIYFQQFVSFQTTDDSKPATRGDAHKFKPYVTKEVQCASCESCTVLQFLECSCHSRKWRRCSTCGSPTCEEQTCDHDPFFCEERCK